MSSRIVITGGSGFIGTNMMQFYIDNKIDVINIDICAPRDETHEEYWHQVDVLNYDFLQRTIFDFAPTHLIHLAARTDLNEKKDINQYSVNFKGVDNVIKSINAYGKLIHVIFSSSMLVCKRGYSPVGYDDYCPSTLYGKSKVLGEKIVKSFPNILSDWMIIRPTSIWGPWFDEPYKQFFELILHNKYFHVRNVSSTKTFGYVKNTVYQIDRLLFNNIINNSTYYLGDYHPINITEWADHISGYLGHKPLKHIPYIIVKFGALMGDVLQQLGFTKYPMSSFRLNNMIESNIIDLSDVQQLIPTLPYSLSESIKETVEWMLRD